MTADTATTSTAQEALVNIQREIVKSETTLGQALAGEPSPELIRHLVMDARLESAKRLQRQTSYLIRLESRPVDDFEMSKAGNVQDRIRSQQRALFAALGVELSA